MLKKWITCFWFRTFLARNKRCLKAMAVNSSPCTLRARGYLALWPNPCTICTAQSFVTQPRFFGWKLKRSHYFSSTVTKLTFRSNSRDHMNMNCFFFWNVDSQTENQHSFCFDGKHTPTLYIYKAWAFPLLYCFMRELALLVVRMSVRIDVGLKLIVNWLLRIICEYLFNVFACHNALFT